MREVVTSQEIVGAGSVVVGTDEFVLLKPFQEAAGGGSAGEKKGDMKGT